MGPGGPEKGWLVFPCGSTAGLCRVCAGARPRARDRRRPKLRQLAAHCGRRRGGPENVPLAPQHEGPDRVFPWAGDLQSGVCADQRKVCDRSYGVVNEQHFLAGLSARFYVGVGAIFSPSRWPRRGPGDSPPSNSGTTRTMEGPTEFYYHRADGTRERHPLNPNHNQSGKAAHAAAKRAARGRLPVFSISGNGDGPPTPPRSPPLVRALFPPAAQQE